MKKKVTSPKKGGRRREPGLFGPHGHRARRSRRVSETGARGEKCVDHRALGGGSASGTLARFKLSAQARRRSEGLAPAASHPPPQPSKRFKLFWLHLKGLYGGLHLPPPPFPPDHRQAGERGAMMLKLILLITFTSPRVRKL